MGIGVDMLDFFRGEHSWSRFHRLISQLPWDSRYKLALSDDPEYLATLPGADQEHEGPPSMRHWDRTREQTALLFDLLEGLRGAVLAPYMGKGKKPKLRTYPRPISGQQRLVRRKERERAASIADRLRPRPADGEEG